MFLIHESKNIVESQARITFHSVFIREALGKTPYSQLDNYYELGHLYPDQDKCEG